MTDTVQPYLFAPTKAEISAMSDRGSILGLLDQADDAEIALRTKLEFWSGDADRKARTVTALICWRMAAKNARKRLAEIKAATQNAGEAA